MRTLTLLYDAKNILNNSAKFVESIGLLSDDDNNDLSKSFVFSMFIKFSECNENALTVWVIFSFPSFVDEEF